MYLKSLHEGGEVAQSIEATSNWMCSALAVSRRMAHGTEHVRLSRSGFKAVGHAKRGSQ